MAESEKAKAHRLEMWREKRRLKRERTGDSPQKQAARAKKPNDPSVKDNAEPGGFMTPPGSLG